MMTWSPTPTRTAVSTLSYLWCQPAWRSSESAVQIRQVLAAKLDDADDVTRLHVAQIAHLLAPDGESGLELVRDHLLREQNPLVSALLARELFRYVEKDAPEVDAILRTLIGQEPWSTLLNKTEDGPDLREPLELLAELALVLSIRYRTPAAEELARTWMAEPTSTAAAATALLRLRAWLELPAERRQDRERAFDLLDAAISSLTSLRHITTDPDLLGHLYITADLVARTVNFASENSRKSGPIEPQFAARALSSLAGLAEFKHPSITHSVIEALGHLAPADPSGAFRVAAAAVSTGDSYTYDQVAASATITLIERYLSEFRGDIIVDDDLLTAIRSVLHAFVDAGWAAAITLAYRLSEAFR